MTRCSLMTRSSIVTLSNRATQLTELMDDPSCDPERLRRTLQRFSVVNRAVACWGTVYRTRIRPTLAALDRPARVLDIGCGGGDVLHRVARRARREGFAIEALGIDPDPRAIEVARSRARVPDVSFRVARSGELVAEGARFDIVLSNHLLHHLDAVQLAAVLSDSTALATQLCVHSDIARSRLAYAAFAVGVAPIAAGTFLRVDGLLSIRRSYTPVELDDALPEGWQVERPGPFRLLARWQTPA